MVASCKRLYVPVERKETKSIWGSVTFLFFAIDPLHVRGNAANLEDRTIRFFYMRIDLNSQKRKFLLFCPPEWLHSHDVRGVYKGLCYRVFTQYYNKIVISI